MAQYNRVTLVDLIARLTERVGNNSVFWADTEKKYAINEAIRIWNAMTGQWAKTVVAMPSQAGTVFYLVPNQLISLQRVRYNGAVLTQSSLFELDNGVYNWQGAATSTPKQWAPVGQAIMAVWPPAPAGGSFALEGISSAPALGSGGDFIDIGDEELGRLLDYAHFYLAFKEGGLELQSTLPLVSNFVESAVLRNKRLRASGYFRKYVGQSRDEEEREPRPGNDSIGARG